MPLSVRQSRPLPAFLLATLLLTLAAGRAQAAPFSRRDSEENPVAGKVLAIILGSVFAGLIIIFAIFGLWLWGRIKKNRREEAEAARAREEGRTSADTVVEGPDNELQALGPREGGNEGGVEKTEAETRQTAV